MEIIKIEISHVVHVLLLTYIVFNLLTFIDDFKMLNKKNIFNPYRNIEKNKKEEKNYVEHNVCLFLSFLISIILY